MDWRHRAACRDEDPELFFPVGNSGPALLQITEAKTVCRRCPVVSGCLNWALESGQDAGVWGGMSEDERRALKRRNARTRAKASAEEPTDADEPQSEPDVLLAAQSSSSHSLYANKRRRMHVIGANGRSACRSAVVSMERAVPAAEVPVEQQCTKTECKRQFAAASGQPIESTVVAPVDGAPVAVAGESVLHEATSRWHLVDERGVPACGTVVARALQQPAGRVERGRRCRQPRCRTAWQRFDDPPPAVEVEPEPQAHVVPADVAPVVAIAGGDGTAPWHALDQGGIACCGCPPEVVVRKLARSVGSDRRCQRKGCVQSWARLDLDLAVAHG